MSDSDNREPLECMCTCGHAQDWHFDEKDACVALPAICNDCPCQKFTPAALPLEELPPESVSLTERVRYLETALHELSAPRGRYSRDPLTHAQNVIEDMAKVASAALAGTWESSNA